MPVKKRDKATQELMDLMGLDNPIRQEGSIRGPMKYPGSKYDSLKTLLSILPYRDSYIEPFGGTGVILLNRRPQKLEVWNDRYSALFDFFHLLRDSPEMLCARLETMLHSRQEWEECKKTWNDPAIAPVERAARWYYMLQYSFVGKGHSWARITKSTSTIAGTLQRKIKGFTEISQRLRAVQIENQDWRQCLEDYDHEEAVFYLDPPYLGISGGIYKNNMTRKDHKEMLEIIMGMKGYVALSGFPNDLYNSYTWSDIHLWSRRDRMDSQATSVYNNKEASGERGNVTECLWVKE